MTNLAPIRVDEASRPAASRDSTRDPRDVTGATTLEFAIIAFPYLTVVYTILNVAFYFYCAHSLDYAVTRTARWAILGQTLKDSVGRELTRVDSIKEKLRQESNTIGLLSNPSKVWVCEGATKIPCKVESAGDPGKVVTIHAELELLTIPFSGIRVRVENRHSVVQNEPNFSA